MNITTILFFLNKNAIILNIICILIIIVLFFINKTFKKFVLHMISLAEQNKMSYDSLHKIVDKIQRSDLDERMVYVIASIIKAFPLLNLIPKPILVSILNNYTQKSFDSIKEILETKSKRIQKELDEKQNLLDTINTGKPVTSIADSVSSEIIAEATANEIIKKVNKILDERLPKPTIVEKASIKIIPKINNVEKKVKDIDNKINTVISTTENVIRVKDILRKGI